MVGVFHHLTTPPPQRSGQGGVLTLVVGHLALQLGLLRGDLVDRLPCGPLRVVGLLAAALGGAGDLHHLLHLPGLPAGECVERADLADEHLFPQRNDPLRHGHR